MEPAETYIIGSFLIFALMILAMIMVLRWVFRINTIVNLLTIVKKEIAQLNIILGDMRTLLTSIDDKINLSNRPPYKDMD